METPRRILIVGGGIGGLTIAAFLGRSRHAITLVERAPAWLPVGAGLVLGPNAMAVLNRLGLGETLRERGLPLERTNVADHRARVLSAVDVAALGDGAEMRTVAIHRATLHETLRGAIDPDRVEIRQGVTVEGLSAGADVAEVTYATGECERFDVVIGADGINSRARSEVFGPQRLRYAGYVCVRFVVEGVTPRDPRKAMVMWGHAKRFGVVPIGGGRTYCFATMAAPGGKAALPALDRAMLAGLFAEFGGDAPALIAALTPDDPILVDDIKDLPTPCWHHGAVVLLGDAAHAATPNLAQGAAMAIEDALVLSGLLVRHDDPQQAFAAYRAVREDRVREIRNRSYALGRLSLARRSPAVLVRNLLMRATPAAVATRASARLMASAPDPHAYDPGVG